MNFLTSHGGHRDGEDDGSDEVEEESVVPLTAFERAAEQVGTRAADLVLMLVQIFIMSTFQPAWFVESSMNEIDSAVRLFTFIGYGGTSATSFMRHLTVRSLQLVGRCKGPCYFFGTGAYQIYCTMLAVLRGTSCVS